MSDERGRRRMLTGRVTSDKMEKTVVVAVDVVRRHRVYGRLIHHTQKFKAHDPNNRCQIGDVVEMRESRPLSREKRWIISRILRGGKVEIPIVEPTTDSEAVPQAPGDSGAAPQAPIELGAGPQAPGAAEKSE